jgi:hypothetical protein
MGTVRLALLRPRTGGPVPSHTGSLQ